MSGEKPRPESRPKHNAENPENPEILVHPFAPAFDENSRVLILGSFPSPASREAGFYYAHPRNRFWTVLGLIFGEAPGQTPQEKRAFLARHRLALWDMAATCSISKASDASLANATLNDLSEVTGKAPIDTILANGAKAHELYLRYLKTNKTNPKTNPNAGPALAACKVPSTSPANAAYDVQALVRIWGAAIGENNAH